MGLRDYWRVLARRWWLIAALVVLAAGSAYVYSKLQQPFYRSSIRLFVIPWRPDYGVTLVVRETIRQYSQLLTTDAIINRVNSQLQLDLPPEEFRRRVRVSEAADAQAILIEADDPNPEMARRIVLALAEAFREQQQLRMKDVDKRDRVDVERYDDPSPPVLAWPRTRSNVLAWGVLGLVVGVLIAFLQEFLDDTVKTVEESERLLGRAVLGVVPRFPAPAGRKSGGSSVEMEKALITRLDPRSPAAEAFRQLRTSIQFASPDRPVRSLLLTSTGPEEGKTTTLANLGIAFAQAGSRVIMVDADLRRPGLHKLFGLKNQVGLTSVVVGDPDQELPLFETGVENLWLLPSGPLPPNPAELLASRRMAEVMERLAKAADYVLYDSPPVLAVTDAAILASRVDGVLLVLQAGKTRREFARRAKTALEKVNARILGTILTGVKPDRTLQAYYGEED